MDTFQNRLDVIHDRMWLAARSVGRSPEDIKLIAVCKTFPAEAVMEAIGCGQLCFGENKLQEAVSKIPEIKSSQPLEWHLVGHLQSNKAQRAAQLFDWVHSVDSFKVLCKLNEGAAEVGKVLPVLIQVDLAGETTKSGMEVGRLEELLVSAAALRQVEIRGFMVLPPFLEDPEQVRPYFCQARGLRDSLAAKYPGLFLDQLSMGMSHDFEVAIQEGATMIRVGTALFGSRAYPLA